MNELISLLEKYSWLIVCAGIIGIILTIAVTVVAILIIVKVFKEAFRE